MEVHILETGNLIKSKATEDKYMKMEAFIKGNGKIIFMRD